MFQPQPTIFQNTSVGVKHVPPLASPPPFWCSAKFAMDSLSALHLVVIFIRNWLLFQDKVRVKLQVFSATLYHFFCASSTKPAFLLSSFTLSMWQDHVAKTAVYVHS